MNVEFTDYKDSDGVIMHALFGLLLEEFLIGTVQVNAVNLH